MEHPKHPRLIALRWLMRSHPLAALISAHEILEDLRGQESLAGLSPDMGEISSERMAAMTRVEEEEEGAREVIWHYSDLGLNLSHGTIVTAAVHARVRGWRLAPPARLLLRLEEDIAGLPAGASIDVLAPTRHEGRLHRAWRLRPGARISAHLRMPTDALSPLAAPVLAIAELSAR